MSAPSYLIESVADMAKIPRDRWDAFLVDLTILVNTIRGTRDHLGEEVVPDGVFTWTDDDDRAVVVNVQAPDGELLLQVEGGPDA